MAILDIQAIEKLLPHRYPFLLVDRIVELEDHRIVGLKNVTMNEPQFTGHFPGFAVMPGVLILEAMAQVAGIYVLHTMDRPEDKLVFLATIEEAKFRKPVVPGDQLRIEVKFQKLKPTVAKFTAEAKVEGAVVAQAQIMCTLVEKQQSAAR
jgi:beta-hydroxyacyl-ACP dehydratase FabZ